MFRTSEPSGVMRGLAGDCKCGRDCEEGTSERPQVLLWGFVDRCRVDERGGRCVGSSPC